MIQKRPRMQNQSTPGRPWSDFGAKNMTFGSHFGIDFSIFFDFFWKWRKCSWYDVFQYICFGAIKKHRFLDPFSIKFSCFFRPPLGPPQKSIFGGQKCRSILNLSIKILEQCLESGNPDLRRARRGEPGFSKGGSLKPKRHSEGLVKRKSKNRHRGVSLNTFADFCFNGTPRGAIFLNFSLTRPPGDPEATLSINAPLRAKCVWIKPLPKALVRCYLKGVLDKNPRRASLKDVLDKKPRRVSLKGRLGQEPSEGLVKRKSWTKTLGGSR